MNEFVDRIQVGIAGLLLGMLLGMKIPPGDAMYSWIVVGIIANTIIVSVRAIMRAR